MSSLFIRGFLHRTKTLSRPTSALRTLSHANKRFFHATHLRSLVKPYLLADIGEGITECRIINWFIKPGDHVSQFDAICEVQSDKASVEITSRYDGIITGIHYEQDEMAEVGKPLLDIDVDEAVESDGLATPDEDLPTSEMKSASKSENTPTVASESTQSDIPPEKETSIGILDSVPPLTRNSGLATPAVRHMLGVHKTDIKDIEGTGKDGRVLKEDVQRHLASKTSSSTPSSTTATISAEDQSSDKVLPLTPIQSQMFKVMTNALSIPHFGYTHYVDFTSTNSLRRRFNSQKDTLASVYGEGVSKLSPLSFIMKALSQAFKENPTLNAHLDTETDPGKPCSIIKHSHDFGVAVDTPHGLLVPVVKGVQNHSILSLSAEINRLSILANEGRLAPSDFKGATFTVSNIGSIGGHVVSPIIVPPMVAIVGIGKIEEVPVFTKAEEPGREPQVSKKEKAVLSWSADHRVLDGALVAKCAEAVGHLLENMENVGLVVK